MKKSLLEILFSEQIEQAGLPAPETEYRFHPVRRWLFDFAWPDVLIAAEVEGGTWVRGRHTRGRGFEGDCIKYNSAAVIGWTVYRFTGDMVQDGRALAALEEALAAVGAG